MYHNQPPHHPHKSAISCTVVLNSVPPTLISTSSVPVNVSSSVFQLIAVGWIAVVLLPALAATSPINASLLIPLQENSNQFHTLTSCATPLHQACLPSSIVQDISCILAKVTALLFIFAVVTALFAIISAVEPVTSPVCVWLYLFVVHSAKSSVFLLPKAVLKRACVQYKLVAHSAISSVSNTTTQV